MADDLLQAVQCLQQLVSGSAKSAPTWATTSADESGQRREGYTGSAQGTHAVKGPSLHEVLMIHALFSPARHAEFLLQDPDSPISMCIRAAQDERAQEKKRVGTGLVELREAPLCALQAVAKINSGSAFQTDQWQQLLDAIEPLPVLHTRDVYLRFLQLYPRNGFYAAHYLAAEIRALRASLEGATPVTYFIEVDDLTSHGIAAVPVLLDAWRVVDLFQHHLPLCMSSELYDVFFDFASTMIGLDDVSMNEQFEACLFRHLAYAIDNTPLWLRYLDWRAPKIADFQRRQEWMRAIYHRILSMPVINLSMVRERYDEWEAALKDGRKFRLEERLEQQCRRAQTSLFPQKWALHKRRNPKFLARPLVKTNSTADASSKYAADFEEYALWKAIIDEESDRERQGSNEQDHARRLGYYLRWRLCFFSFDVTCWMEAALHYHRSGMFPQAREVLEEAIAQLPGQLLIHFAFADVLLCDFRDVAAGHELFRGLIATLTRTSLQALNSKTPGAPESFDGLKEKMCLAYLTWMRWSRHAFRETGTWYMRLVAQHAVKSTRLFDMLRTQHSNLSAEAAMRVQAHADERYATFMECWVSYELTLNNDAGTASTLLDVWAQQIKRRLEDLTVAGGKSLPAEPPEGAAVSLEYFSSARNVCSLLPNGAVRKAQIATATDVALLVWKRMVALAALSRRGLESNNSDNDVPSSQRAAEELKKLSEVWQIANNFLRTHDCGGLAACIDATLNTVECPMDLPLTTLTLKHVISLASRRDSLQKSGKADPQALQPVLQSFVRQLYDDAPTSPAARFPIPDLVRASFVPEAWFDAFLPSEDCLELYDYKPSPSATVEGGREKLDSQMSLRAIVPPVSDGAADRLPTIQARPDAFRWKKFGMPENKNATASGERLRGTKRKRESTSDAFLTSIMDDAAFDGAGAPADIVAALGTLASIGTKHSTTFAMHISYSRSKRTASIFGRGSQEQSAGVAVQPTNAGRRKNMTFEEEERRFGALRRLVAFALPPAHSCVEMFPPFLSSGPSSVPSVSWLSDQLTTMDRLQ